MLTASVVIYHSQKEEIKSLLKSVQESNCVKRLYIIDNASTDENRVFFESSSLSSIVEYIPTSVFISI